MDIHRSKYPANEHPITVPNKTMMNLLCVFKTYEFYISSSEPHPAGETFPREGGFYEIWQINSFKNLVYSIEFYPGFHQNKNIR